VRRGLEIAGRYNNPVNAADASVDSRADVQSLRRFSFGQRLAIPLITWGGFLAVRLIGPTLRLAVSFEEGGPAGMSARPMILAFWHDCIFPAIYFWRNLQNRVMSSDSFDGEYTGRIIRKYGFVKVRGSSSHGAVRGMLGMRREIEQGASVAFTIDGPRGPRYVAKPGPVVLARATGAPIVAFHIAVEKVWELNTWDRSLIPKPCSRALMRVSRQIAVPASATEKDRERFHAELQAALDRVREFAEENVRHVGGREFPVCA
jgi:lysophospholipid acyltransferase (LPLAT)-like uncharacterized protein